MSHTRVITGLVLVGALAATPAFAKSEDEQRQRGGSDRQRSAEQAQRGEARQGARAVPRSQDSARANDNERRERANENERRQYETQRQIAVQRQYQAQRQYDARRDYDSRRDNRYPYYADRGYHSRTVIVPRIIRPSIVTVVPYRPYVYRPSFGIGVYYGAGGSYPYGYTPRGYYDPLPGHLYGGLRITGAPREAQVFADGYYVGIVNDFDGVFQHINLEAGTHHIEIEAPGIEPVAFDVLVQPGRTITFRADIYPY
jgi:hypothetical protein